MGVARSCGGSGNTIVCKLAGTYEGVTVRLNSALEILFALFLGVLLTGALYALLVTLFPAPPAGEPGYSHWPVKAATFLILSAMLAMVASLSMPERLRVLANGVLFGGLYTMVIGVLYAMFSERAVPRLILMFAALAVTLAVGYVRFTRRAEVLRPAGLGSLEARVEAVERKLKAISDATR